MKCTDKLLRKKFKISTTAQKTAEIKRKEKKNHKKCVTEWALPRMESMKNRLAISYDNLKGKITFVSGKVLMQMHNILLVECLTLARNCDYQ